jgi:hypothetical protein
MLQWSIPGGSVHETSARVCEPVPCASAAGLGAEHTDQACQTSRRFPLGWRRAGPLTVLQPADAEPSVPSLSAFSAWVEACRTAHRSPTSGCRPGVPNLSTFSAWVQEWRASHRSPTRGAERACQSSSMRRQSPVKADLAASTLGDFNARCRASIRTLVAPPQWGPVHVGVRPDPVLQSQRRAPVHRGQESSVAVTRTRTVERLKISSGRRRSRVPPPFQAGSVRRVLCSGSYTSPVIHRWCSSTASFRATATTARFLAFFPPRAARASPLRRRSVSGPKGPRM